MGKETSSSNVLFRHSTIKSQRILLWLIVILALTIFLSVGLGVIWISPADALGSIFSKLNIDETTEYSMYSTILFDVRIPRVLMGAIVGAGLSAAGCALQGLFRNPMASPFVLGVSNAAAVGVALALLLPASMSRISMPLLGLIFALFGIFLVYNMSKERGKIVIWNMLLIGISASFFFSAIVSILQYLSGEELRGIVVWLMGTLSFSSWKYVAASFPIIAVSIMGLQFFSRQLNIVTFGDDTAQDLGVDVEKLKKGIMILSAVITGTAVAFSGPIGFVGLIIPHIARIFTGPDHRVLILGSCLIGAIFLIWADNLARISINEIPVGVITSLCGAPFFVYLLRRNRLNRKINVS